MEEEVKGDKGLAMVPSAHEIAATLKTEANEFTKEHFVNPTENDYSMVEKAMTKAAEVVFQLLAKRSLGSTR